MVLCMNDLIVCELYILIFKLKKLVSAKILGKH